MSSINPAWLAGGNLIKLLETGETDIYTYLYSQGGETYGIIEISLWIIRIFFNVSIDSILLKYHLWLGAVAPLTTARQIVLTVVMI